MNNNNSNAERNVVFSSIEIEELIKEKNYADALIILLRNQKIDWSLLENGFELLKNVKTKSFQFEEFSIDAQFNPGRIKSTSANVDKEVIKKRECFLCEENLPTEQKGINYKDEYLMFCNPYPIFIEHFTIVYKKHFPQRISESFYKFLKLSKRLGKYYSVLYNGPDCGASAPDHLHFQAVNKNNTKILNQSNALLKKYGKRIVNYRRKEVFGIDDGLRKIILIKSKDIKFITNVFKELFSALQKATNNNNEPMLNIVSSFNESGVWELYVFLRKAHRPKCFYAEGEKKLLISPAVIDLSGTLILPREEDFDKISKEDVNNIFKDVVIGKELFDYLKMRLKKLI